MATEDEIESLKRKLYQTEARLLSNLLLTAQETLPEEQYQKLCERYKDNQSLDLLDMERSIADSSKLIADGLQDLYEAVGVFKAAKKDFDAVESGNWSVDDSETPEQVHNKMVRTRERMFSLFDEYNMKRRMSGG